MKIGLGVAEIGAVLHAFHLDKAKQGFEVLLLEYLVGKPCTY